MMEDEKLKWVPKQKFSFKSRGKATSPSNATTTATPAAPFALPPTVDAESTFNSVADNGITLSTSNTYLSTSAELHPSNIRLLSMIKSVVNLLHPTRHATLHARDLSNCIVIASEVDGPAHLTNLSNCILVLKCHQVPCPHSPWYPVKLTLVPNARIPRCQSVLVLFIKADHRELSGHRVRGVSSCDSRESGSVKW